MATHTRRTTITVRRVGRYGFWNFVWDAVWTIASIALTGLPLWLIWVFVREMRRR